MNKIILALLLAFFLSGCIITNTPGFYSGYKKLSNTDKEQIVFLPKEQLICNKENDLKIYAVTAQQLSKCLEQNDTSVVYFWSPNCSSKSCILIDACQNYCDKRNFKLYVITEYYDLEKISYQNKSKFPLISINQYHYKTDYCNKYVNRFTKELIGKDNLPNENTYGRFYIFNKEKLLRVDNELFK